MHADAAPLAICISTRKGGFLQLIKCVAQAKFLTCTSWQSISRLFQKASTARHAARFPINHRDFVTISFRERRRLCPIGINSFSAERGEV